MNRRGAPAPEPSKRVRLLFLFAAPLSVAAVVAFGSWFGSRTLPDPAVARAELTQAFDRFLERTGEIADRSLEPGFEYSGVNVKDPLLQRLEGIGFIGNGIEFDSWVGRPAEPPDHFTLDRAPRWRVHRDGVKTRLIVRGRSEESDALSLATFVLESTPDGWRFESLIAPKTILGYQVRYLFQDTRGSAATPRTAGAEGAGDEEVLLTDPDGHVLAQAVLEPLDVERRAATLLQLGIGWALVLFSFLLGVLFDWGRLALTPRGWLLGLAAVAGGRALLLTSSVPSLLMARSMGTASLYGTSRYSGLLGSPIDLLLTGMAIYLACLLTRGLARLSLAERLPRARWLSALGALAATGASLAIAVSVARDSRLDLLHFAAAQSDPGARWSMIFGWTLALVGAAELWATTLRAFRSGERLGPLSSRWTVGVMYVVVAGVCGVVLQSEHRDNLLERLDSEFVPQILDQQSRRELALVESVRMAQAAFVDSPDLEIPSDVSTEFLAHSLWIQGDLHHGGFKSSLDLYRPDGERISHFGFDLPPVEDIGDVPSIPEELVLVEDAFFASAARIPQKLLVAEAPIRIDGKVVGRVVGSILDEPNNLPFLPENQTYLAALGAGTPLPFEGEMKDGLHYVLYHRDRSLSFSTLDQPPALSDSLLQQARNAERIEIDSGDGAMFGVATLQAGQVHLLLIPRRDFLSQAASWIRFCLVGFAWMLSMGVLRFAVDGGGIAHLVTGIRRSFYRKLLFAVLVASALPLIGLSIFLGGFVERTAEAAVTQRAAELAGDAQFVVEDFISADLSPTAAPESALNDNILFWLRRLVGQELHVYVDGVVQASSKPELFGSGLLPRRLDGTAQRALFDEKLPYFIGSVQLADRDLPVAYAHVRDPELRSDASIVVAVPILKDPVEFSRSVVRLRDMILLATVALVGLLAAVAAGVAGTVARPVRALVGVMSRLAGGDYDARLEPQTEDEIAELVGGFNRMASALSEQRKDLEQRREYTERLVRHAPTGVISTDSDGRIVKINPAAAELLRSAGKLRPGDSLPERLLKTASLRPLLETIRQRPIRRGEPTEVDLELDRAPRRYRVMRIQLVIPGSDDVGDLLLLEDITDLMRSNQLEAWAEMARAIAHEIKNPLTPIQLSTDHMRRLLADRGILPDRALDECLDTVIKQVQSLHEIAGEFSTYSKLPALVLQPMDPVALMRSTIGPYRAAHPPGITIRQEYESAPTLAGDAKVLTRALVNLVENALHAMSDGGELVARVCEIPGSGKVELSIRDTGPGLEPEVRRRLFEPYFSTKSSGTGLGLAIVKRAVEAHHGTIEVESEPGHGTIFRIRLPIPESNDRQTDTVPGN